VLISSLI